MSSTSLNVGVCLALALGSVGVAAAPLSASEPERHANILVKATGQSGTVSRTRAAGRASSPAPLPAQLEGGEISRTALQAELARGIGRFLQQVKVKPVVSRGRFVGWRITSLFPARSDVRVQGVEIGDIVLRANGQSLERPEDLVALWGTLGTAKQLVLEIERAGEATRVLYEIE